MEVDLKKKERSEVLNRSLVIEEYLNEKGIGHELCHIQRDTLAYRLTTSQPMTELLEDLYRRWEDIRTVFTSYPDGKFTLVVGFDWPEYKS